MMSSKKKHPDKTGWMVVAFLAIMFLTLAFFGSGCRATIGNQEVIFRVGQRTAPYVQENADGEKTHYPGLDPEGQTLMFFIRGRL